MNIERTLKMNTAKFVFTLAVIYLFACQSSIAQDYVPAWEYDAGSYFASVAMSPNGSFIASKVMIERGNNPNNIQQEVHLLNADGSPLWRMKWGEPDATILDVAVSNAGDVAVLSRESGMNLRGGSPDYVRLIDKNGETLFAKTFGDRFTMWSEIDINKTGEQIAVSIDGNSKILLLDRNGKVVFEDGSDNSDWHIQLGGSCLAIYDSEAKKVQIWNPQAGEWWSTKCPYSQLCRVSPSGAFVAVVVMDALAESFGGSVSNCDHSGDIALYDVTGSKIKTAGFTCTVADFAITDSKVIVTVNGEKHSTNFLVQLFDFATADTKVNNIYSFDQPSGKHGGGKPQLSVSNNGEKIVITTPYKMQCLTKKTLEKKW